MTPNPDFDELAGDVAGRERERLQRVHDLLVAAGPLPELSPGVELREAHRASRRPLGRRLFGGLAPAATLAAAAFLLGFVLHGRTEGFDTLYEVEMSGTAVAPGASATIEVADKNDAGNYPLRLEVERLPQLPRGGYYELLLTRDGREVASCGTFAVSGEEETVRLNAPYELRGAGWIVTKTVAGKRDARPVLEEA
jgi:hypothetical protein